VVIYFHLKNAPSERFFCDLQHSLRLIMLKVRDYFGAKYLQIFSLQKIVEQNNIY